MPLAEHGGADFEGLAGDGLGAERCPRATTGCTSTMGILPITYDKLPSRAAGHAIGMAVQGMRGASLMSGLRRQTPLGSLRVRAIRRFTIRPVLPEPLAPLRGLMLNLRWSWHAETQRAVRGHRPGRPGSGPGGDPVALLAEVPPERLAELAADRQFLRRLSDAGDDLRDYLTSPRWYQADPDLAGRRRPWPTSRPSTASPRRCRSTRAAWASWPATT